MMGSMAVSTQPRLTLRELNRATLARQHLLERTTDSPLAVIERLVGMQSQIPAPPFTGLWSRVEGFAFDDLSALMLDRSAIRLSLMRCTVHLVSARDALALRPRIQELYDRQFLQARELALPSVDVAELDAFVRALLGEEPRTTKALGEALEARWPGEARGRLVTVARLRQPLLQIPPRGVWGKALQTTYALLDDFTGETPRAIGRTELVRRYLAAAGPATAKDFQLWSGLTGWEPVFAGMAEELLTFQGPRGELLFDLPDAPRPAPDTPAPVRLLPEWDSTLMMYADRCRVVTEDRRKAMLSINGIYAASVLVDGFVVAACKTTKGKTGGRIDVWPFERLIKTAQRAIATEGDALLTAMGKGYAGGDVVFHAAGTGFPDRR